MKDLSPAELAAVGGGMDLSGQRMSTNVEDQRGSFGTRDLGGPGSPGGPGDAPGTGYAGA